MSGLPERHGRVFDADGEPVPDALISIVASTVPMPEIALISDDQGRFALRLPAGHFTLRAHGSDGSEGEIEVDGAPSTSSIVIQLGR